VINARLLTVQQAAELLRVSPQTIHARISRGDIPAVKLRHGMRSPIRISEAEIEEWVYANPDKP